MYISLCVGVKSITAYINPTIINITSGGSAAVSCTASPYVDGVTFMVDNVAPSIWASRGIGQSASTYSGSSTTTALTVEGKMDNDNLQITCRVFVGSTYQDISPPAVVIIVEGRYW